MQFDLHTHTTASDGALSPQALYLAAAEAGLELLAITDHDSTAGIDALRGDAGHQHGPRLIGGIELSTCWRRQGIHVLGLNVDTHSPAMRKACLSQSAARDARAQAIARRLAGLGVADAYAGAALQAAGGAIGRPHFAQHLVETGVVKTYAEAFKKYLGNRHDAAGLDFWAPLQQVIEWIDDAGGVAVLAHPAKYKLTRTRLELLVQEFQLAGGNGLEVVSGQQPAAVTRQLASLARRFDLSASAGSDFHQPGMSWAALGHFPALPDELRPVWHDW